jgi:hypothetical protein
MAGIVHTTDLLNGQRWAALVVCLYAVTPGAATIVARQADSRAEANQLHAAIDNGDVDALRYWLSNRHADPNAPNAHDPDVTPLARCLALAARVLDGSATTQTPAGTGDASSAGPLIGLRTLQEMVALLDAHGARLTDADKRRFSAPVLRWYADAVSRPGTTTTVEPATVGPAPVTQAAPDSSASPASPAPPAAASPKPPSEPDAPATPPAASATPPEPAKSTRPPKPALVVISPDPRKACNGTGHRLFLLNKTEMAITATVTTYTNAPSQSNPSSSTSTYIVGPSGSWELGCTATPDGGSVRYELNGWK